MLERLFGRGNSGDGCFEVRDKLGGVHRVPHVVLTLRAGITREEAVAAIAPFDKYRNMGRAFVNDDNWPIRFFCGSGIVESIDFSPFIGPEANVDGIFSGQAIEEALRRRPDAAVFPHPLSEKYGVTRYLTRVDADVADEIGFTAKDGKVAAFARYPRGHARKMAEGRQRAQAREDKIVAQREEAERRRAMADPAERLLSWAKVAEYWGVQDGRFTWYADRLIAATPDEWHDAASTWNWDYGREPLRWIISQPNCDTATVKKVFEGLAASFGPEFASDPAEAEGNYREDYELIHAIIARWQAGFWTRSALAYESESDPEPQRDDETAIETAFRELEASQPGRTVPYGCFLAGTPHVHAFS